MVIFLLFLCKIVILKTRFTYNTVHSYGPKLSAIKALHCTYLAFYERVDNYIKDKDFDLWNSGKFTIKSLFQKRIIHLYLINYWVLLAVFKK